MDDADLNRAGQSSSGLTLVLPSLKALKELKAKRGTVLCSSLLPSRKSPAHQAQAAEGGTYIINYQDKKPVDPEKVPGYMDVIKQPMDFGTMSEKIVKSKYKSLDEFADDFRLVISNAKTGSCVIEYETDWNIEVDRDEDVNVDADEDGAAGGASAGPDTPVRRSPSVASASVPPPNRRGRATGKKEGISETLEPDGHLPGYKDGVGIFPPGSDWAEAMLALKLKGKRYRSKKERLRMEKGGPPYAADGSLDYSEMEDPFSVLSALVPDPLFPPEPPEPVPQPTGGTKYRHWTILRSAPPRGKAKETAEERPPTPEWRKPRPLDATDFGVFPVLATNSSLGGSGATEVLGTQERLFDVLHTKLESALCSETSVDRAIASQSWLREVVFGGFDGLAYVRSVAEFLTPSSTANDQDPNLLLQDRRHRVIEATLKGSKAVDQKPPVTPLSEPPFVSLPPTPLDLGSLISAPNELFDAENVWAGAGANEDSAVLSRALDHAAHILEQLHEVYTQRAEAASSTGTDVKFEETVDKEQDMVTELRMNLIALAKRAPVDQIAKIPSDLVPPHLRGIIPTIDR
ncbi:hypothetical protein BGW80DRAFT_1457851 [Lactifluus volemus]|nr:hypothetical protein BGW80DRAFT_1457851 [Lactifluus volemus]